MPKPVCYDDEDGPFVTLVLPREVVLTLREVLFRHVTPNMGVDSLLYEELGYQLRDQVQQSGDRLSVPGGWIDKQAD